MKPDKNIQEELENLSPFLAKMRKEEKNPFALPANYFDTLADNVLEQCGVEEKSIVKTQQPSILDTITNFIQSLFEPRYALAFAAIAVLIIASVSIFSTDTGGNDSSSIALTNGETESYIIANIDEFEEDLITDALAEANITDFSTLDIGDEDLELYLDDLLEDIDEEGLEELL